jgi:PAS domain S-box-containing protein
VGGTIPAAGFITHEALLALQDASPDGVLLVAGDGRVKFSNIAAQRLFGHSREEMLGLHVEALIPPRHRERHVANRMHYGEQARARPMGLGLRLHALRRDGSELGVEISLAPMEADGELLTIAIVRDATEQRALESRLSQAQKMELVGQLAGGIAHDFNNLLTIVSGYAQRLRRREDLTDAVSDLDQIIAAADRAGELTRQLLFFARRGQLEAVLLDPGASIRALEPMIRRLLDADIVLDIRLARNVPHVLMDRAQLEQVLMNLIINASDAMRGGGTLKLATRARGASDRQVGTPGVPTGDYVEVSVSDTGVGMPSEVRERIFEPFFTTKPDEGTGMGLATVYDIVEQAGGWIEVESQPGVGTTFSVVLPVARRSEPVAEPARTPETTLMVVEDEPALRQLVATMLAEDGYLVLEARNGRDALAVAERHDGSIDLLITDVVMPHLTGPELAKTLQGLRPGLEVLFMSGYNDSRLVGRGLVEGTARLLVKPFTPDQLLGTVRELTAAKGRASVRPGPSDPRAQAAAAPAGAASAGGA